MKNNSAGVSFGRVCQTFCRSLNLLLLPLGLMLTVLQPCCGTVISSVNTSLTTSQKFYLQVDSKPFFLVGIQVRLDKERYVYHWDAAQRAAIVAQAASDGFNTIEVPIQWVEIEPSKDHFDWTILNEYLGLAKTNNLKMEILWFSQNQGGHVGWMTTNQLRVPAYVLSNPYYDPSYSSTSTTSDYKIARSVSNYTLDLTDTNLMARETYVVGQLMAHIASWDATNGNPHTVVGMQLGNEVTGFSASQMVAYYSAVGSAVKNSSYSIWTRMNSTGNQLAGRLPANEALRSSVGTYVDFVGIDLYTSSGYTASDFQNYLPSDGENFKMVMEGGGAEDPTSPCLRMAAISGDNSFAFYDLCGPDGHGLYDTNATGFVAHGSYVNEVRTGNKLLTSDVYDLARLSAKSATGLYVHNWAGNSTAASTGIYGISFTPPVTNAQAISIRRSSSEIVLMNTLGGTFTFPTNLTVYSASQGYFNTSNVWVNQGSVAFTSTGITPPAGSTVLLAYTNIVYPPSAPTGLGATAVLTDQINLAWTGNDAGATGYQVERSTDGTNFTQIATITNVTSYANTGLWPGTTYYYRVCAFNSAGNSPYSNITNTTTPPVGSPQVRVTASLPGTSLPNQTGPDLATSASFDMAGGNAVALMVTAERAAVTEVISAAFAGQPMTLGASSSQGAQWSGIFYLINPGTTSGQFAITSSTNLTTGDYAYSAIALSGVASVASWAAVNNTATGGSISLTYTTAHDRGFVVGAMVNNAYDANHPPPAFLSGNANQDLLAPIQIDTSGHLHTYGYVPVAGTSTDVYTNLVQRNAFVTLAFDTSDSISPKPPVLLVSSAGKLLTLSWPNNAGWTLQRQTNRLSTGLGTNWVDVPGSTNMISTNIVVDPNQPAVFYRLKL